MQNGDLRVQGNNRRVYQNGKWKHDSEWQPFMKRNSKRQNNDTVYHVVKDDKRYRVEKEDGTVLGKYGQAATFLDRENAVKHISHTEKWNGVFKDKKASQEKPLSQSDKFSKRYGSGMLQTGLMRATF